MAERGSYDPPARAVPAKFRFYEQSPPLVIPRRFRRNRRGNLLRLRCCVLPIEEIATALKGLAMTVVVDCCCTEPTIRKIQVCRIPYAERELATGRVIPNGLIWLPTDQSRNCLQALPAKFKFIKLLTPILSHEWKLYKNRHSRSNCCAC